jgi:hypothetical protein
MDTRRPRSLSSSESHRRVEVEDELEHESGLVVLHYRTRSDLTSNAVKSTVVVGQRGARTFQ